VKLPSPGKRDPFLSPIAAAAMKGPVNCNATDRKQCLVVSQLTLKGVVQMKEGNIAVVENPAKRPYFLKENDALFDGSVLKITSDSVVFRETSSDIIGRPVSREVIKKVTAPSV
jgi:Tfp pilus assembly protein PilP